MKKMLLLTAMLAGLLAAGSPGFAQQAGASMQDGPYTSAAQASSHRGGMRERMARRHHHYRHYHHRRHHHRMR